MKKIKKFITPTVPRIMLYSVLFFIAPTFFKACNGTCNYTFKFLGGYRLFQETDYVITVGMLLLLFTSSYLFSCTIASTFSLIKKKRMMLQ
jgi:hypothetical protein